MIVCTHERRGVIKVSGSSSLVAMNTADGRGQIGEVRLEPCLNCGVVLLAAGDLALLRSCDIEYSFTDALSTTTSTVCGALLPFGDTCTFPKGHETSGDPLERMHGFRGSR